jgi:hypothetical protein
MRHEECNWDGRNFAPYSTWGAGEVKQKKSDDIFHFLVLLPSTKESIFRIRASQTFLSLTIFIKKSNNIHDIKCASYENIFYDESNDINLIR